MKRVLIRKTVNFISIDKWQTGESDSLKLSNVSQNVNIFKIFAKIQKSVPKSEIFIEIVNF